MQAKLEERLRRTPTAFDFFQAVRVLERLRSGRSRVGGFDDPSREVVRFSVPPTLAFPASWLPPCLVHRVTCTPPSHDE